MAKGLNLFKDFIYVDRALVKISLTKVGAIFWRALTNAVPLIEMAPFSIFCNLPLFLTIDIEIEGKYHKTAFLSVSASTSSSYTLVLFGV